MNDDLDYALGVLQMAKMAHEAHWPIFNYPIDLDSQFELFYEILELTCEDITAEVMAESHADEPNYEYEGYTAFRFLCTSMDQYVSFCEQYGKERNILWHLNPYVLKALRFAQEELDEVVNRDYGFTYWIESDPEQLEIKFDIDYQNCFCQTNWLTSALYHITLFFDSQVEELGINSENEVAA